MPMVGSSVKIEVPEHFAGQTIALNFKTFEEGWDATNPQFILYVNGEQIQGVDINHREIILTHNSGLLLGKNMK